MTSKDNKDLPDDNQVYTVAENLAETLYDLGVSYIFGIPGGPSIPYMEAARKIGIEFILVANEASAGIMADVVSRLTGIPGVCFGTFGPGATNLSTGVGCAYLDRVSLIALTSEQNDKMLERVTQMNIDHQALFTPVTKMTFRLKEFNTREAILKAAGVAMSEVPGPVHIGLPVGLAEKKCAKNIKTPPLVKTIVKPPDRKDLENAASLFRKAKKPILAVGLTAGRLKLDEILGFLINKHKIPVVLTPMAKGMLTEDDPCYAGVLFHALGEEVAKIYREADLIIGIGYDPVEFNYEQWMPEVPLVHMDTSPADIESEIYPVTNVIGNLKNSIEFFTDLPAVKSGWDMNFITRVKQNMFDSLKPDGKIFGPKAVLAVLREVLPGDGIMTCDVGAHTHLVGQAWRTPAPGLQIMTNGWSTMGFGIPAAIAAKLCLPDKKVACITGDGGFLMMAGEMVTARNLNLNIVFIILVDNKLSLIKIKQRNMDLEPYGVELCKGEFFGADFIFGIPVKKVQSSEELFTALREGFEDEGPAVIEAIIDGSEYRDLITREYK